MPPGRGDRAHKTRTQAVVVLFRIPDLTAMDRNEPAGAASLNRRVQDPTKETFNNVSIAFNARSAG